MITDHWRIPLRKDRITDWGLVVLIGSSFVLAGLWIMFGAGKRCLKAYGTKDWKHASGRIIESRTERSCDSDGDTIYEAKISYVYSFQGETYNGNRIHLGYRATSDKEDSEVFTNLFS